MSLVKNSEGKTLLTGIRELSPRSKAALKQQKIFTLEDALRLSDSELLSIEGVGQASIDRLRAIGRGESIERKSIIKEEVKYKESKGMPSENLETREAEELAKQAIMEMIKTSGRIKNDYSQEAWKLAEQYIEYKNVFRKAQSMNMTIDAYKQMVSTVPQRVVVPVQPNRQVVPLQDRHNTTFNTIPGSPQYSSPPAMISDDGEDLNVLEGDEFPDAIDV